MHLDLLAASKPIKSSNLAIPPSPFSPRLPLTPPATPPNRDASTAQTTLLRGIRVPPPPQEPLHWLWQCHLCNRCYQLGVTRRCLDDGHYFCSGTTTVKRSRKSNKKIVRHQACASEFDYQAWKMWGQWRRSIAKQIEAAAELERMLDGGGLPLFAPTTAYAAARSAKPTKNCWNMCDYPSECRWGKQHGVQTPTIESPVTTTIVPSWPLPSTEQIENVTPMDLDDVDLNDPTKDLGGHGFSDPISITSLQVPDKDRKPSIDDLLESAKRRKRRSAGLTASPLASNPPSQAMDESASSSTAQALQKAFDDFELDF